MDAFDEAKLAKRVRTEFKKYLANKYDLDAMDISVSSSDKCMTCSICGGEYYRGSSIMNYEDEYRCNVCDELISEKRRMVTRIDGIVFMRRKVGKKIVISKYLVTKLGNLKKISSSEYVPVVNTEEAPTEMLPPIEVEVPQDSGSVGV